MMPRAKRVDENESGGRDFVVGDLYGEPHTLGTMLARLEFRPGQDRHFARGDRIDRCPRSADALAWREQSRIMVSARGNHEQMLLERIRAAEGREVAWSMHRWFPREVDREQHGRWRAMIEAMPIAATVRTRHGYIDLVHASPTARHRETMLAKLAAGDSDTIEAALWSSARTARPVHRREGRGAHGARDRDRGAGVAHARRRAPPALPAPLGFRPHRLSVEFVP